MKTSGVLPRGHLGSADALGDDSRTYCIPFVDTDISAGRVVDGTVRRVELREALHHNGDDGVVLCERLDRSQLGPGAPRPVRYRRELDPDRDQGSDDSIDAVGGT